MTQSRGNHSTSGISGARSSPGGGLERTVSSSAATEGQRCFMNAREMSPVSKARGKGAGNQLSLPTNRGCLIVQFGSFRFNCGAATVLKAKCHATILRTSTASTPHWPISRPEYWSVPCPRRLKSPRNTYISFTCGFYKECEKIAARCNIKCSSPL